MRIIEILRTVVIAVVMTSVTSCNYLNVDRYFVDTFSKDSVFINKINLNRYLWNIPTMFEDEGGIWAYNSTPGLCASGEVFSQWDVTTYPGVQFYLGNITPDNLMSFGSVWTQMYKVIRRCNTILDNIDQCKDLTALDRKEVLGYTYFMRAYAYYQLLVDFGPVVLVGDDLMETNREPEYYARERATFDESADYICEEFEKAAKYMPTTVPLSQFGRPTQGAALALVARIRLMQASPSFNGGLSAKRYFSQWKRDSDGADYVSQTYDDRKWAVAAYAAKRVIDMGIYQLFTVPRGESTEKLPDNVPGASFPNGAGDINPYRSYKDMFSGEAVPYRNPEFIWGRYSEQVRRLTRHSFPVETMGGWNEMSIPQKFIDAFYMEDGRDISQPSEKYPYDESGFTDKDKNRWGYVQKGHLFNMYNNREWRFYANIGFHGCFWPCNSTSEDRRKNWIVKYSVDGNAGKTQTDGDLRNYPITGYVSKKYIHDDDAWAGNDQMVLSKAFPIIRYAEILISYAEALNNIQGSHEIEGKTYSRNLPEIQKYFNMIRYRSGLPGVGESELASAGEMQKVIEREWMIEFFHENRYYYNIRRWGTLEDEMREPVMGMNTDALENEGYFTRTVVNHPFARYRCKDKKLVFLPIGRDEVRKHGGLLKQNPGY